MTAQPVPAADRFVIRCEPKTATNARKSLSPLGPIEPLGLERADLFHIRLGSTRAADPRAAWRLILSIAPELEWAAPVLLDEREDPHFPTGSLAVRFLEAPSDAALARFAAGHRLRTAGRNAFVPAQVRFEPADPRASYLPDVVAAAARDDAVAAAWAETLSRYRRA